MATNDFIGFASAGSANIMSQADFAAAAEQTNGVQPGPASSSLANKVWRQGANMAAALGWLMSDMGQNALDDGDIGTLKTSLKTAIISSSSSGIIKTPDGTMIEWGAKASNSSAIVTLTFPEAFYAAPHVVMQFYSGEGTMSDISNVSSMRSVLINTPSTTGVKFCALGNTSSNPAIPQTGNCGWIAIGRWKA